MIAVAVATAIATTIARIPWSLLCVWALFMVSVSAAKRDTAMAPHDLTSRIVTWYVCDHVPTWRDIYIYIYIYVWSVLAHASV